MITEDAKRINRNAWPPLYRLAERYDVTISALCVRLEQLGLLCISDGKPYESHDAVTGQNWTEPMTPFFKLTLELNLNTSAPRAPPLGQPHLANPMSHRWPVTRTTQNPRCKKEPEQQEREKQRE